MESKAMMTCNGDAAEVLDNYQQQFLSIDISGGSGCEASSISDLVNESLDRYELAATNGGVTGLPTGFADLDAVLGGLQIRT